MSFVRFINETIPGATDDSVYSVIGICSRSQKNFTYQEWIISASLNDIDTNEVGRCSDGSTVVDLINKIY